MEVLRVNTNLVTVPVNVMDRQGRFIPDLRREQFHLYEDGVEQDIAFFENAEKPFTVALLLDTSDSTKFRLNEIQEAALAFIEQLHPDDRVMVATFDKQVRILSELSSDHPALHDAILRARSGGGTSLYKAIDLVIGQRLSRIRGRKAVVLFTDGVDTASAGATYQSTLHLAAELDALVYTIQYNTYEDVTRSSGGELSQAQVAHAVLRTANGERLDIAYARADRYLHALADMSGGRSYYVDTIKLLTELFTGIAKELREQYSIGYYPGNQGQEDKQRQIKLRVNVPGLVVRARKSYLNKHASSNIEKQGMRTAAASGVAPYVRCG